MLPPWVELTIDVEIASKLLEASRRLAHLKGFVAMLPDRDLYIDAIVYKEATASCAIDGIDATDPIVGKYREVLMRESHDTLSQKGLKEETLLNIYSDLRSDPKGSGNTEISEQTGYLTHFMKTGYGFPKDPLFRMALAQYQFEAIQPSLNGGGRTGRLASIVYLIHEELLGQPSLCLSAYHLHKFDEYTEALKSVSSSRNWRQWVIHMLDSISSASDYTVNLILRIKTLKEKIEAVISENGLQLDRMDISTLFGIPYVSPRKLMSGSIKSVNTAKKYLGQLEELGILSKTRVGREYVWVNTGLMDLLAE